MENERRRMKRNEKKPLGCGICPYKTNSACHLERHLRIHTGQKPYACDLCSYRATDGGLLKRHKRVHSGEKPFICQICGHKTAQSCSLKDHMAVHTGKKRYSCDLCSFQCSRIGRLRDHQRVHQIKTEFKDNIPINEALVPENEPDDSKNDTDHVLHRCPHCNLEFSEVQYLERHVSSVHSTGLAKPKTQNQDSPINEVPESSNVCSLCASPQESSEDLENHVALHVVYRCLKCKSIFETSDELTAHGIAHTSDLIFDCNFCDFKCKTRNELRGHGRIHSTQQFKCSICDFESKSPIEFSQHLLTHTMKEMVICHICSHKFRKTEELREHMVSHYTRVRTRSIKKLDELKQNCSTKQVVGDSYSCFYCSFKCPEEREVEKHILDVHVPSSHPTTRPEETEKFTESDNIEEDESKNDAIMDVNRLSPPNEIYREQGGGLLKLFSMCPVLASKHHQMDPSIAGFSTSMGQLMSRQAFSMTNLHAKSYGGCRWLGMPSSSLWNYMDGDNALETKYFAYSVQCGNLQFYSDSSRVIHTPDFNTNWSIVKSNQMYQRFLMSSHINQQFSLHTRNEQGTAQGQDILNREGIRSFGEYISATGTHERNYTSIDTRCESYSVENGCSQEENSTVQGKRSSPYERHNRNKQLVTVGKRRNIAGKRGNSELMLNMGLETGNYILNSSHVTGDLGTPCANTKPVQNATKNSKVGEFKDSDRIHENGVFIDGAISVKRSRAESVKKCDTELERRVTRSSQRGRKNSLGDTSMETADTELRSPITEHEVSSGDILLSKLRKFFNESLPKFNAAAHSKGNFSPQADNENDTTASSPIFTIDLSSDNETTELN